MKIRSLSHSGVTVSNFQASVKWYYEMFGLMLIDEQTLSKEQADELHNLYGVKNTKIRLGFLRAPKGGVVEIFEFTPSLPGTKTIWNKPGITHITFDVKNVPKWYERLSEKGVEFFSKPQKTGVNEWVFLKDIDGNLIELIDLKANYFLIRFLGGIVERIMSKGKFKKYYE